MAATYTLISSQVLGSNTATITFSSIPQTYTDLKLVSSASSTRAYYTDSLLMVINGDTGSNYSETYFAATQAGANASRQSNLTYIRGDAFMTGTSGTSNTFANNEIYIPNYSSTGTKQLFISSAAEVNGTSVYSTPDINANLYRGTSAITSFTLSSETGSNFTTNSSFYLYGLKNA